MTGPAWAAPYKVQPQAQANASGVATIVMAQIPAGLTVQGTIVVPGSNLSALWTLKINGLAEGEWVGISTAGPFTASGPASVVLVGTGCTPGQIVQATWTGVQGTGQAIEPIWPAPMASLPQVSITNATIPISGNVNANITNASIPVTGSVNATITNASIPVTGTVNARITNATIAVTGTLTAHITNATIPVSGTVTITAGVVEVVNKPTSQLLHGSIALLLGTGKITVAASSWGVTIATLKGQQVQGLLVVVKPTPGTTAAQFARLRPHFLFVRPGQPVYHGIFGPSAGGPGASTTCQYAYFSVALQTGVTHLAGAITFAAACTGSWWIYGITGGLPSQLRGDLRPYPIGRFNKSVTYGATDGGILITAPGATRRIVLSSLALSTLTTTGYKATVREGSATGNVLWAVALAASSQFVAPIPPSGFVLTPNTALYVQLASASTTKFAASALYDVIG
jgi:hypothetical protein